MTERRDVRAFLDDYWTSGLERLRDVAEAAEDRKREATDRSETPEPRGRP